MGGHTRKMTENNNEQMQPKNQRGKDWRPWTDIIGKAVEKNLSTSMNRHDEKTKGKITKDDINQHDGRWYQKTQKQTQNKHTHIQKPSNTKKKKKNENKNEQTP